MDSPNNASNLELRRLELEAQERHEDREYREKRAQRSSDLFKWFVMLALQPFIGLATTYVTTLHQTKLATELKKETEASAAIVAEKADEAVELVKKVDETSTSTNAITARWWADRSGDPRAAAKAVESERRLEAMNPDPPISAAPPP